MRCDARRRADHASTDGARDRRAARERRDDRRRRRRLERRFGLDLPAPARARAPQALDRQADRARALFDEPVRLVLRHATGGTTTSRTTRSCSARATASCSATSSTARCWPTTSASTCTGRPRPIRRSRPTAATRSTCCRRCRISRAAPTGRRAAEPLSPGDRGAAARRRCCPGLGDAIVTSRLLTPQDFQDRLSSFRRRGLRARAGADAERVVPAAQPERGGRSPLSRRRGHASRRRPARRAVVGAHPRQGRAPCRQLARLAPDRSRQRRASIDAADLAACRALLANGSRTFLAASYLLPRAVRDAGLRALRVLPRRRRRDRRRRRRRRRRRARRAARAARRASTRRRRATTRSIARFAARRARARHPARAARRAARRLRVGRGGPALRDARRPARLRRARRRHGRRDDGAADGRARRRRRWRAPATSASRCSSPTSPATSARTRARAASTCRAPGCARPASIPMRGSRAALRRRRSARSSSACSTRPRAVRARRRRHRASCRRRAASGINAARCLYAEIGHEVARRGCDSVDARAVVSAAAQGRAARPVAAGALRPRRVDRRRRCRHSSCRRGVPSVEAAARPPSGRVAGSIDLFERLERQDRVRQWTALDLCAAARSRSGRLIWLETDRLRGPIDVGGADRSDARARRGRSGRRVGTADA